MSFYFTNEIKKDEKDDLSSKTLTNKGISKDLENNKTSKSNLNSLKSSAVVKSENKKEEVAEIKIPYKYFDSIGLENNQAYLVNNKDFVMKSFCFKDFKYDTNSLESVIYFLMYLLSKKEPGIIRYWAMKNRYGIGLNKASDPSIISKKLSNGCWISFCNRSIENYKELFEALKGKLNIKFESVLYFVFREKEENVNLDKDFSDDTASKNIKDVNKNSILNENEQIKLMDKAEFFASEFINSKQK